MSIVIVLRGGSERSADGPWPHGGEEKDGKHSRAASAGTLTDLMLLDAHAVPSTLWSAARDRRFGLLFLALGPTKKLIQSGSPSQHSKWHAGVLWSAARHRRFGLLFLFSHRPGPTQRKVQSGDPSPHSKSGLKLNG